MTYSETLQWMYSRLPMYQKQGKTALKAKLDNILKLSDRLGKPHTLIKTIHVAGTNGKGSSSHMIASILQEAGYKVGLYSSPHLKDFRERIKINGKEVSKQYVINFIKKNKSFLEENNLSFFEMTTGMAFSFFASKKVDIAIIEVGLGGRFDSTNIIKPEVCLITNIGYDHTDILGDTLPKIAFEKAGIIKQGVPVVISEYNEETFEVFKNVALQNDAQLIPAFSNNEIYKTDLLGEYQSKNIKGVVSVINQLNSLKVKKSHITKGLLNVIKNTNLKGRWQILNISPKIVADTAHNKEGIEIVIKQLKKEKYNKLHIVLGFVKDKKLDNILPLFPEEAIYYFCSPKIDRGLSVKNLFEMAHVFGLNGKVFNSVSEAYNKSLQKANKDDLIYVGGSTFVVAEII
ncbi:bifunctional folylpolyglutamate synthase/dihydrofolate synthase [Abyssalbus ytuae]|uniref:Dihydrofolate synthase/folylpolyglutamate synthase n=1 Tax=Abyssalbus ytuae TaxID=2926907 RepID=A0A9E6ZLX6_9FLAO|nr:folylpolyglutamate synthase/dihydrofolate synthase family protein [Abyssalbus ytuae]UOB16700.1 bifunctional folylpolyglutamate synthase/dihydrofolate synthase [Abyssalbus ytuae]